MTGDNNYKRIFLQYFQIKTLRSVRPEEFLSLLEWQSYLQMLNDIRKDSGDSPEFVVDYSADLRDLIREFSDFN